MPVSKSATLTSPSLAPSELVSFPAAPPRGVWERDYFRTSGTGKGQFDQPLFVACDCSGTVYVSDNKNHRVHVFTAD